MTTPFKKPYLIQRICKPYYPIGEIPESAKAYYLQTEVEKNQERSDYIRNVLRLDYMGSAEFEFGEVPKALKKLAQALQKNPGEFHIVEHKFTGKPHQWGSGVLSRIEEKEVGAFLLCHKDHEEEILKVIRLLIKEPYGNKEIRLKERAGFTEGLFGTTDPSRKKCTVVEDNVCAWMDLDNPWILCKDKNQLNAILLLLGHEA